jgi:hypothetical protein
MIGDFGLRLARPVLHALAHAVQHLCDPEPAKVIVDGGGGNQGLPLAATMRLIKGARTNALTWPRRSGGSAETSCTTAYMVGWFCRMIMR